MTQPLEQMLSPIYRNRNFGNNPYQNDEVKISLIEKIRKEKYDILQNNHAPYNVDIVRSEIVDSWIRSKSYGLDLFKINEAPILAPDTFQELLQEKDSLIRIADSYCRQLINMLYADDCSIILSDEQGVILRIMEANGYNVCERNTMVPGAIWKEEYVGTCSHSLCLLHETPIQICGPEHYCEAFDTITCSSAPIYDSSNNIAATLTIASLKYKDHNPHTLGFTVSMAWTIQNELKLSRNDEWFYATLEAYKEAIMTVDKNGLITRANKIAQNIFSDSTLTGYRIDELIGFQPVIQSVMSTGLPTIDADIEIKTGQEKLRLYSIQPVKNNLNKTIGCVLNLKKITVASKQKETSVLEKTFPVKNGYTFEQIISSSPQMGNIIEPTRKFAQVDSNILIQGESGTGKELFAQAIHNEKRSNGPFIALNCAAIPRNLMESELFGYEGGAFTGAERKGKPGKIELAQGGTLFLDEIGDMPLEVQPILLRVLEEKKIMRLGGSRNIPIDFSLIAATNKDLFELVKNKLFREDLYYRLAVFTAFIPPLRERKADILILTNYFLSLYTQKLQCTMPRLSQEVEFAFLQYNWPGNVRQLENAIFYAMNLCRDNTIQIENLPREIRCSLLPEDFPSMLSKFEPSESSLMQLASLTAVETTAQHPFSIREIEKAAIIKALVQARDNVGQAAKDLGFCKATLYRKIREYQIDVPLRKRHSK
ncbi:sigma 54-interacting transcriptional regulator [Dehalobacter sp. DCM]|uniref:sigma-54-dependent Fis family transcriptional regulator n=1 Tax=Dehalobacter sp. DCM TaxID=2907827 RepID=UPI00308141B8|nr:sigma 54-interacting transcriptional regulator [Dehalobacter sp. DCM]